MHRNDLLEGLKFLGLALFIGIVLAFVFQTCGIKPALAEKAFRGTDPEAEQPTRDPPQGAIAFLLERDHTPPKDHRWTEAEAFEKVLIGAALDHGIDPALFIAMAYRESSFETTARGRMGELGLVQVHGKAARGCELKTAEGQARCGAAWLARVTLECGGSIALDLDQCRSTASRAACSGGLAAYASGSCSARTVRTAAIIRTRLKLAEKIRPHLLYHEATLASAGR
jgi:hypothetical protein